MKRLVLLALFAFHTSLAGAVQPATPDVQTNLMEQNCDACGPVQSANIRNVIASGWTVVCKSSIAVAAPADTNEDVLATCTIPSGTMGANGWIRVTAQWSFTNNVNNKTGRARLGGASGTIYYQHLGNSTLAVVAMTTISNRGSPSSQTGNSFATSSAGATAANAPTTSSVDTTAATTFVITCQKASSGDSCQLESYLVELYYSK